MATTSGSLPQQEQPPPANTMSSWAKGYLVAYNVVQTGGWGLILFRTLRYLLENGHNIGLKAGAPGYYELINDEVKLYQTLAFLEIIHCMVGLVRANVMTTSMQVYSRIFMVWGIMAGVHGVSDSLGVIMAVLAWAISEVIRYWYYACSLIGNIPYFIVYLRYTMFYILYPIGVLGELMMMFTAMPVTRASQQWSLVLPNPWNMAFSYYYYIIFNVMLYIPAFPQLYGHMIVQRKKTLNEPIKSKQE